MTEGYLLNDTLNLARPVALNGIERDTAAVGFTMISEPRTGVLLRTFAASKPGGVFLELGTGTGASTAWILDGMNAASTQGTRQIDVKIYAKRRRPSTRG